ncbi:hypothetical protein B0A55_03544 [Friedmanniomyces simplex]|uniref:Uncharacterized protein n=1 Tax=Friedmanniomyces simplex TaxID=329884 RepID=A0A4U0XUV4_9PEZI|nr:hypothetical protein B0A55_03544 [Friedmanniomyces simplex]
MSTDQTSNAVVRNSAASNGPPLIAENTLEGLPDELLVKIVGHAMETHEAVNLCRQTMRQDIQRIRCQLLQPFTQSPKLLAMAKAQCCEEDLVYRFSLDLTTISRTSHPDIQGIRIPNQPELFFKFDDGDSDIMTWIGKGAERVRYLEVIIPATPYSALGPSLSSVARNTALIFGAIRRAFPRLQWLVVRFTTYRIGDRNATFCGANSCPDPVALGFRDRLCGLLAAVEKFNTPHLKDKEVVFFQKPERSWREWRNGPLGEPFVTLQRSDFDSEDWQGLAWQMMDLPSCRLRFRGSYSLRVSKSVD